VPPGRLPVLAAGVEHLAILLEEFVRHLEDRDHLAAIRTPGDVPAACRPPDEFPGLHLETGVGAFLVDQRSFEHVSLLDQDMLVIRQRRARLHLDQDGRETALGIEQQRLGLAAGKAHFLPRQILRPHMMRAIVVNRGRVLGIRLDVHRALPCGAFSPVDDTPNPDQLLNLRRGETKKLIGLTNNTVR
jgi:hypothetical protein